jgi:CxC5 like cysteine cluster associated with KDZ transposases
MYVLHLCSCFRPLIFRPGCRRRYYHNYVVHADSAVNSRTYYPGVPDVLQVAEHFFIDASLLEFFANGKVFGW